MKKTLLRFLVFPLLFVGARSLEAQTYSVGDVVGDFELIDRATGQPARLSDFAGSIIILEWFAVWCPFCQAAAPEVDEGILQFYERQGGNPNGVPVMRIGLNLQADGNSWKSATDGFIQQHHLFPTLEDTSRSLARQFFSGGSGQPLFAIINGIAGSPSHEQWELLQVRRGFMSISSTPIEDFRTAINRVAAPVMEPANPVRLISREPVSSGVLSLRIEGNRREEIRLRRSDDLVTWTFLEASIPDSEEAVLSLPVADLQGDRFVQAVRE